VARSSSWIRTLSNTLAGSSARPFSVISWAVGATRSAKVEEPGSRQPNLTTVVDRKVVSLDVRSSSTAYESTSIKAARPAASSRVRFMPGTCLLPVRVVLPGNCASWNPATCGPRPLAGTSISAAPPVDECAIGSNPAR
jgi:hypothetical protein